MERLPRAVDGWIGHVIVVLYEDRVSSLVGVQLAVLSLARHSPGLSILAIVPDAPESFLSWGSRIPGLSVKTDRDEISGQGWNVKPSVLQSVLRDGHEEVVWFDSDLIATGDIRPRLAGVGARTLVATEEYYWGHHQNSDVRTVGLGLEPARVFRATLNTCLLRVTSQHAALIEQWSDVLTSDDYVRVQHSRTRPIHYYGDQEVLTGLLGSTAWADIPVDQLRRGTEVAQCFGPSGFTVGERLRSGRALPLLVHAMGAKPWTERAAPGHGLVGRVHGSLEAAHLDLTPYVEVARHYRGEFDGEDSWLTPRTRSGRSLTRLFARRTALRELPLAIIDSTQRRVRRTLNIGQVPAAPSIRHGGRS